jgi:hypothetical protein
MTILSKESAEEFKNQVSFINYYSLDTNLLSVFLHY